MTNFTPAVRKRSASLCQVGRSTTTPKWAHRDVLAVDEARRVRHLRMLDAMGDDLVPVEVEVDPVRGTAAFRAARELAVEAARDVEVGDRKREVEARIRRGGQVAWCAHWTTSFALRAPA